MSEDGGVRFQCSLALELGCTLTELQHRLPSWELPVWAAYYRIDPWGRERGDLHAGIVACTIASCASAFGKRRKQFKPSQFMPKFGAKRRQSVADLAKVFGAFAAVHNAGERKGGKSNDRAAVRNPESE